MARVSLRAKCAALCLAAFSPVYAVSFNSLGPVNGNWDMNRGVPCSPVVSGDGSTVVATSGRHGFKWTLAGGKVALAGANENFPTGLSYDGSTVVGASIENGVWKPVRWQGGVKSPIDVFAASTAAYATGVSADGQTVVGLGPSKAFKWNSGAVSLTAGEMTTCGGISADGAIVAGIIPAPTKLAQAAIWKDGVVSSLGSISTDPSEHSFGAGVSPDGNVVFGYAKGTTIFAQPFRWTAAEGMVDLGAMPGPRSAGDMDVMRASNYDGSVLVGSSGSNSGPRATIWDAQHGLRFLDEVLSAQYGIDLTGWTLQEATGMSWDGHTIVGYGVSPQGPREAWVARLPEPASVLMLAVGLAITGRRSRS